MLNETSTKKRSFTTTKIDLKRREERDVSKRKNNKDMH